MLEMLQKSYNTIEFGHSSSLDDESIFTGTKDTSGLVVMGTLHLEHLVFN